MTGDTTSRGVGTSQGEMGWIFFRGHALRAGGRRAPRMMPQCQGVSEGGGFPGEVAATARQEDPGHFLQGSHLPLLNPMDHGQNRSKSGERGSSAFCSSALTEKLNCPKLSKRFSTHQVNTLGWKCYLHAPAKQSFLELPQEESNLPTAVEITLLC